MIDIELQRTRSAMAESVTLPIATWLEVLDELEALRQVEPVKQVPTSLDDDEAEKRMATPKQEKCECVVKRLIFSGDREYCETCGFPIYTFEEHRARLLEEYKMNHEELVSTPVSDKLNEALWCHGCNPDNCAGCKLPPIEPVKQEPVCCVADLDRLQRGFMLDIGYSLHDALYAHQIRTKDLTDDEIEKAVENIIFDENFDINIARAVIAADRAKNNLCESANAEEKNK